MQGWFNLFGWLLSALAAVGNGFVVFLIAKTRRLHCPSNWFVLSLAVADLGVGVFVFPMSYLCNLQSKPCNMRVHVAFYWFLVHASVTNLCCLAWDRYFAIIHPLKYDTSITARRSKMVISVAWLIPLLISLMMVLGMYATSSQIAWKVLRLTGVTAFDLLACALALYAVVRILIVVRAQSLKDAAVENNTQRVLASIQLQPQQNDACTDTTPPLKSEKHHTVSFIIAIMILFLGCYVAISSLIIHIVISPNVPMYFGWYISLLLVANSAANPLVYAFLKHDIKTETIRIGCRKTQRKNDRSSGSLLGSMH